MRHEWKRQDSVMRPLAGNDFQDYRPLRFGRAYYATKGEHAIFRWGAHLGPHGYEMGLLEMAVTARKEAERIEEDLRRFRDSAPKGLKP